MKGLLLKDYYCMKSNLFSFLCLTIGVIVIGVLFAISIHHGNMADVVKNLSEEEGMSPELVYDSFRAGVWLILMIPMAYVGNVIDCFKADMSASFGKILFSMPMKASQVVGARYLACLLYAGISFFGSLLAALCVSSATEYYPLSELLMVCATFGALFITYLSIVIMLLYLLGTQHADGIMSAPILIVAGIGIIYVMLKTENMGGAEEDAFFESIWGNIKDLLMQYTGILCGMAMISLVVCFVASVKIVEKRRARAIC